MDFLENSEQPSLTSTSRPFPTQSVKMASSAYQSDNTFFVESDEPSQRMTMRDAAKMLARNKQEMIANELSRLACDEYLEDIMQHIRQMEVRKPARQSIGLTGFVHSLC